jgi:hypothetical protein
VRCRHRTLDNGLLGRRAEDSWEIAEIAHTEHERKRIVTTAKVVRQGLAAAASRRPGAGRAQRERRAGQDRKAPRQRKVLDVPKRFRKISLAATLLR